jgi:hypothetical protein
MCLAASNPGCVGDAGVSTASSHPAAGTGSAWTDITPPVGAANPSVRSYPAMAYDPAAHAVILFGGLGYYFYDDTWSFSGGAWTELISGSSCTATTCPGPREQAMMAYDPSANGVVLFGGVYSAEGVPYVAYDDTWVFSAGSWTNITSTAGTPPSPRVSAAMTYDPSDNWDLLFGGGTSTGTAGDTWEFSDGKWTNLTASFGGNDGYKENLAPEPRVLAAIAASPDGHVMLFGGEDVIGSTAYVIENSCYNGTYVSPGVSAVAWWFFQDKWTPMAGWGDIEFEGSCVGGLAPRSGGTPDAPAILAAPPCGRIGAALGWSPRNDRFALFGGEGVVEAPNSCSASPGYANDSWTYGLAPGGEFLWYNASAPQGDPPLEAGMGYATDYTDGYFYIFGGRNPFFPYYNNETWRFYEPVHAELSGPATYSLGVDGSYADESFTVVGYGGSNVLDYTMGLAKVRNANALSGCSNLTSGAPSTIPFNGTWSFGCTPSVSSFNIYRATLTVTDTENPANRTSANLTFEVVPSSSITIYSEYARYFYSNVSINNTFYVEAEVQGAGATSLNASLGSTTEDFAQNSTGTKWWNATVNMSSVAPGSNLFVEAQFGNWTLNDTYAVPVIQVPSWLETVLHYLNGTQKISTHGKGPFGKTFWITESYAWNISSVLGFNLSIPLVGGNYSLIPSLKVVFNATSSGNLTILGDLALKAPSINISGWALNLSANISLAGTFDVANSSIQWVQASVNLTVAGTLQGSIPLYGFDVLGVSCGFTLTIGVSAAITLELLLAPTTMPSQDIISGIGIMIQNFIGSFQLVLQVIVSFSIGFASIGIGGNISIAAKFVTNPSFNIAPGWVNGSVFIKASALIWSKTWNLVNGTIYSWGVGGKEPAASIGPGNPSYNNGTGTPWRVDSRYYVSSDYDGIVWNARASSGPAISDIYPSTEVSGASGYNGAYLFYSNQNPALSAQNGLGIAALRLNGSSNSVTALPAPDDPGFEPDAPEATTLPDGNLFVVWEALPTSEAALGSPLNLTTLPLHGAVFSPENGSWGPIETFDASGIAESYAIGGSGTGGDVVELIASTPLVSATTPERLVEYDLSTGASVASVAVTGLSRVTSLDSADQLAVVESVDGNFTVLALTTGLPVALALPPDPHRALVAASFAQGAESDLVLLYRQPFDSELAVEDAASGQLLGSVSMASSAVGAEGFEGPNGLYLFVQTGSGILVWSLSGATFTNVSTLAVPDLQSFGLAQVGGSILVYAVATNGNASRPLATLWFAEVGAALTNVTAPPGVGGAPPAASTPPSPDYLLYLGLLAGGVAVALAIVALVTRRRTPRAPVAAWTPAGAHGATPAATPPDPPPPPPNSPGG